MIHHLQHDRVIGQLRTERQTNGEVHVYRTLRRGDGIPIEEEVVKLSPEEAETLAIDLSPSVQRLAAETVGISANELLRMAGRRTRGA